jgi:rhodanese-related sulfurtransferase
MKNKSFLIIAIALIAAVVIYKFFLGTPQPTGAELEPDKFQELAKEKDAVLLDVRSTFEFGGDKIAGAQNISYTSGGFKGYIEKLDKNKTYLVYCASGSRSAGAVNTMKELGFKKVYNLTGGIEHWKSAGKPVIR